jgi:hypothetical protein
MVGEQNLVTRREPHRLQHERYAGGGVRNECAAVRVGAENGGEMPPGVDDPIEEPWA